MFAIRTETTGGPPPMISSTPRDLTLDDALSLSRSSAIRLISPLVVGAAPISWKQRQREVMILGSTSSLLTVRQLSMTQGQFLPEGDPTRGLAVCIIGYNLKNELFGNSNALGEWIRIGDRRFRVIGILAKKGQSLGMDMADIAIIPVASAQVLFNTSTLFRILVQAESRQSIPKAAAAIQEIVKTRHDGEDDITIITQDSILSTSDRILKTLTYTVAGIAAISLIVAGILIMNVMLIAVSQRTTEIGLLKAIGATEGQIWRLFLSEATFLSWIGAILGLFLAFLGTWGLSRLFPTFPITIPIWAIGSAMAIAIMTGLVFGVMPAKHAAQQDPVMALSRR